MKKRRFNNKPFLAFIIISVFSVACSNSELNQNLSQKHKITTKLVTLSLEINFNTDNEMTYINNEKLFHEFIKEYHRRGRSELVVSTTPSTPFKQEQSILSRIRSEGIGQALIELKRGKALRKEKLGATLSFKGYVISVPKCENWMEESSFNPNNLEPANFGCSYRRNIGLMLSDPGDLVNSGNFVEVDARRMDTILGIYRSGQAAGAAKPVNEAGKFSAPQQK